MRADAGQKRKRGRPSKGANPLAKVTSFCLTDALREQINAHVAAANATSDHVVSAGEAIRNLLWRGLRNTEGERRRRSMRPK